jgi:hypothetical protein
MAKKLFFFRKIGKTQPAPSRGRGEKPDELSLFPKGPEKGQGGCGGAGRSLAKLLVVDLTLRALLQSARPDCSEPVMEARCII